ncbi:isoquinoline 1-oxidoreductase, beta subunit [Tistlia consotensis]|uniref:Isoquinoline 1-oxidoreductase, beta subunit n=2 Tax=Tistlia TaxID=1321364 RepID=A0A1Y6C8C5_9PROT|nr:molybdopterin cofactor-binding domain-containing protein [Tistlia consotensis]SMF41802.1 isoquinoline 1-oxidoreductase, beta subunit [Tistlia consotensis USBA 355]SNR73394.1 isoquinoline 1-oxidoreductase, beta subunit [Tistlia consotensis]
MLGYLDRELSGRVRPDTSTDRSGDPILVGRLEKLDRRRFLQLTGAAGAFVVAFRVLPAEAMQPYPTGASGMPNGTVSDPHVFVAIAEDGTVTIVAHRAEMGTGVRTSLPMVVADEMEADWARVTVVQAPGDEPKYGNQDTDGSRSLRHFVQPMRQCGAAMRAMLEAAAAARWGLDPKQVKAELHEVVQRADPSKRLGYGALAKAAMAQPVPPFEALAFKDESEFRYIGKGEIRIVDLHDITTGKATYGADVRLPGMKYAVVARPPVVGGRVKSYDASAALKVPGVEKVVEIPGSTPPAKFAPLGGIAVVADNTWTAMQGRDQLKIEWDDGPNGSYDTTAYRAAMSATAKQPGKVIRKQGDPDAAFAAAARVVSAEYYEPHVTHAPMEPPAAVANVTADKAEVWAPVQSSYGTREDVAKLLGLPIEQVTVNVTLLGGGFGRKSKCDYVQEAALVSRAVGAPVKLQWSREDEIHHSFYHTTSVERIEAALDGSGKVTAWRHRSVAPSILSTFAPDSGYQFPIEYGMGFVDMPFDIPNVVCENGQAMAHTRIGWFRSVSNVPRAFAVQSFAGELAHELGRDPKEMLLELIGPARIIDPKTAGMPKDFWNYGEPYEEFPIDTGRLRHVVELAADKAGWGKALPKGEGLGIAAHRSFVSYIATVVHVKIGDDGAITVPEVTTAVDCGYCINPERVESQMQGAAVMGMTLSLYSAITFAKGRVEQSNFYDYEMARMTRYPEKVAVHVVPHPFPVHATGVGEPGVPPFAPALANAIFAATGKRLRDLPFGDTLS